MSSVKSISRLLILLLALQGSLGCQLRPVPLPPGVIKPTAAVTSFENRSNFEGQWQLGGGMADLLVSELLQSGHFEVLERQHLQPLVGEIELQSDDLFRAEGKVDRGKLKNARYLIRGVVTDFSHVSGGSFRFLLSRLFLGGWGYTARVAMTLTLVDVESGKIVAAVQSSGEARAGATFVEAGYGSIAFGGEAFFKTPLGVATRQAVASAVVKILNSVEYERWRPTLAAVDGDGVILTGGSARGVRRGQLYWVQGEARNVTDPQTGDLITHVPGSKIGVIRVVSVEESAAYGEILYGAGFVRGQALVRAPQSALREWARPAPGE